MYWETMATATEESYAISNEVCFFCLEWMEREFNSGGEWPCNDPLGLIVPYKAGGLEKDTT